MLKLGSGQLALIILLPWSLSFRWNYGTTLTIQPNREPLLDKNRNKSAQGTVKFFDLEVSLQYTLDAIEQNFCQKIKR